jgi:hypothetical protein
MFIHYFHAKNPSRLIHAAESGRRLQHWLCHQGPEARVSVVTYRDFGPRPSRGLGMAAGLCHLAAQVWLEVEPEIQLQDNEISVWCNSANNPASSMLKLLLATTHLLSTRARSTGCPSCSLFPTLLFFNTRASTPSSFYVSCAWPVSSALLAVS